MQTKDNGDTVINYPNGQKHHPITTSLKQPKKSKYRAVKTTIDDITFDSLKEARRYKELKVLERAGMITNLRLQVPYILIPKSKYGRAIKYIADFVYSDVNGNQIVEDVKSIATKTPLYKFKKRLMQEIYNVTIQEV